MLLKAGQLQRLQKYTALAIDPQLLAWWARFQESQGNAQAAMEVGSFCDICRTIAFCLQLPWHA